MTTYMIHDDGEPVSIGTVLADPLPDGLVAVPLSDVDAERLRTGWRWNPQTLAVDIEPPPPEPDPVDVLSAAVDSLVHELAGLRSESTALYAALDDAKVIDAAAVRDTAAESKDDEHQLLTVAKVYGMEPDEVRKRRITDPDWWAQALVKAGYEPEGKD